LVWVARTSGDLVVELPAERRELGLEPAVLDGGVGKRAPTTDAAIAVREVVLGTTEEQVVHGREEDVDRQLRGRHDFGELEQNVVRGDALTDGPVRRIPLAILGREEARERVDERVASVRVDARHATDGVASAVETTVARGVSRGARGAVLTVSGAWKVGAIG